MSESTTMSARPLLKLRRPFATPPVTALVKSTPTKVAKPPAAKGEALEPGADVPWHEYHYVWCPAEYRPHRRYACEEAARLEARRLRSLFPAKRFLVFRAVCVDADERAEDGQAPQACTEVKGV
jgi:hypothetical protein